MKKKKIEAVPRFKPVIEPEAMYRESVLRRNAAREAGCFDQVIEDRCRLLQLQLIERALKQNP